MNGCDRQSGRATAPGLLLLALLVWLSPALAAHPWSEAATPAPGRARVIGAYSAGCLAGAAALPLAGEGYQVMRPSRNRYYGHPALIAFVERLARQTAARGGRLLVGDLGQPRGGPMASGHRSHQIGLDVDIWFRQVRPGLDLTRQQAETLPMLSMVAAAEGRLDAARWSPLYRDILRFAAEAPGVDRIFVNPLIKRALCRSERDRSWLHKLRPWWGHDAHFHVRLGCPAGQSECRGQAPVDPGDGCDAGLEHWVRELREAARSQRPAPKPSPRPITLPAACTEVLAAEPLPRLIEASDTGARR